MWSVWRYSRNQVESWVRFTGPSWIQERCVTDVLTCTFSHFILAVLSDSFDQRSTEAKWARAPFGGWCMDCSSMDENKWRLLWVWFPEEWILPNLGWLSCEVSDRTAVFDTIILYAFHVSFIQAVWPLHYNALDLAALTLLYEIYKLWSFMLFLSFL
jgi:hypothetical protein